MIPQIKKILYTTDLSRNSAYAFYYAVDMAQRRGATIIILHAIEPVPAYVKNYLTDTDKIAIDRQEAIIEKIQKRIDHFCKNVDSHAGCHCADLVSKSIVRLGHPVDQILKVAEEEACDVIVMGNHGKGLIKQTFLGSISRGVLDSARQPVFIIPLPPESEHIEWASM